jgi:hypothetical protein
MSPQFRVPRRQSGRRAFLCTVLLAACIAGLVVVPVDARQPQTQSGPEPLTAGPSKQFLPLVSTLAAPSMTFDVIDKAGAAGRIDDVTGLV